MANKRSQAVHIVLSVIALFSLLIGLGETFSDNPAVYAQGTTPIAGEVVSDDFDRCTLSSTLWTFTDPQDDTTLSFNGTVATMAISADVEHDLWEAKDQAPRLMQPIANADFEIEVKFESAVSERFQTQGILVQADARNFLRFDMYHDGTSMNLFAASFADGVPTVRYNQPITPTATVDGYFLRVARQSDSWKQQVSFTGADGDWTDGGSFNMPLITTSAGIFGGNASPGNDEPPPAFTMVADYVFNTASPIAAEDDDADELNVAVEGQGSVEPAAGTFACGEQVALTATPADGWVFSGWTGDLVDSANPGTVTVDGATSVTAVFVEGATLTGTYLPITLH